MRRRTLTFIKKSTALVILIFVFRQILIIPTYVTIICNQSMMKEHQQDKQISILNQQIIIDKMEMKNENSSAFNSDEVSKMLRNNSSIQKLNNNTISEIILNIYEANRDQTIRNEDILGPITNNTVIIVIQVHNRLTYLRQLIISLSMARDIEKTLLIFSHDVWDEEINHLVRLINFSAVMQIFYPFSLQIHPHSFPGESRRDCPRDAKPNQAATMKCINKDWPDLYGHYREAKFTQTKHHWWWKANQVFDKLSITSNFQGTVLFLEEDHYVAEDFLYVLKLMEAERLRNNQQNTHIVCLGTYLKKFNYKKDTKENPDGAKNGALKPHGDSKHSVGQVPLFGRQLLWIHTSFINSVLSVFHKEFELWKGGAVYSTLQKVESTQWVSSKHNMGMTLNREQWKNIEACSPQFCEYDDYNWDWSLQHVSLNCLKEKLQVLLIKGPRVFHIGECGVHHKKSDCETSKVLQKVKSILESAAEFLFPERLAVVNSSVSKKIKLKKGNGGWGDKRDHALCLNMTWRGN